MKQVAVCGVDLDDVDAEVRGATGSRSERIASAREVIGGHGEWLGVVAEGERGGSEGRPATLVKRHRVVAPPGGEGGALATGVRELDREGDALAVHELDDRGQGCGVLV